MLYISIGILWIPMVWLNPMGRIYTEQKKKVCRGSLTLCDPHAYGNPMDFHRNPMDFRRNPIDFYRDPMDFYRNHMDFQYNSVELFRILVALDRNPVDCYRIL